MLKITNVAPASSTDWDDAMAASPVATFFHSRTWAEIWHRYRPDVCTPAPLRVEFSDGMAAVVPLTSTLTRSRARVQLSSPAGTYGGWISGDPLARAHADLVRDLMLEEFPDLEWRINPFDPLVNDLRVSGLRHDFTQVLSIARDMDEVVAGWTKGSRSAARKALRSGLVVREASGKMDWRSYYGLYRGSLDRWGASATSEYGWGLFDAIRTLAGPHARLWLAEHDGAVLAGALCFYAGPRIAYWHGASTRNNATVRPANGLLHEVLRHGSEAGYRLFDFCPSGGHEGVARFKSSFGVTVLSSSVIVRRSRRTEAATLLKRLVRRSGGNTRRSGS